MSLTSFVGMPDVASRLDAIAPHVALPSGIRLVAPPVTTNHAIVGTAFDYLLRFELHRRMPHAKDRPWEANGASVRIFDCAGLVGDPMELMEEMDAALDQAKRDYKSYLRARAPSAAQRVAMATHAIRLAQMDRVNRGMRIEPYLAGVDERDVRDLLQLLAIVPPALFAPVKRSFLNPHFGASSVLVGGADCDLIIDGALIDIKTSKLSVPDKKWVRQIVGYFILARHARAADKSFPDVKRMGFYFARQGHMWLMDADELLKHPMFSRTEKWFIERAEVVFAEPEEEAPLSKTRLRARKRSPRRPTGPKTRRRT